MGSIHYATLDCHSFQRRGRRKLTLTLRRAKTGDNVGGRRSTVPATTGTREPQPGPEASPAQRGPTVQHRRLIA